MIMFIAEWILASSYSIIHIRTFLFFGVLYCLLGVFVGCIFAVLFKWFGVVFKHRWWRSDHPGFLPAIFLAVFFLIYGLYHINGALTPTIGMFAPFSLLADFICFGFAVILFRAALSFGEKKSGVVPAFLRVALLPLSLLVAVNLRFFALQPRVMQIEELFFGTISFGVAALLGILLARVMSDRIAFMKKDYLATLTHLLIVIAILFAFSLAGTASSASFYVDTKESNSESEVQKPRNIIWIVMDTARRDHVSVYGGERDTMPNLRKFSQEALVFDHAISTAPWTFPSHASMFTGMYSSRHGAHHWNGKRIAKPLSPENLTIAEILASRGYQTAAIVSNHAALSRNKGIGQGFQFYFDSPPFVFSLLWGKLLQSFPQDSFRLRHLWVNRVSLASDINATVFEWLERRTPEQPFFLFINYMDAHNGIAFLPDPYDSMYGFDRKMGKKVFKKFNPPNIVHFKDEIAPAQNAFWSAGVQRRLSFLDMQLAVLFEKLRVMNIYEDALIIVSSDHGELFGEHNSFGHQTDLYNELINIPMMLKYPQAENAGRSDRLVQTVDVMPEILSYLGVDIPNGVQGQPFDIVDHAIIAELFEQKHNSKAKRNPGRYYRDLKAIFSIQKKDLVKYIWASNGKSELFNLKTDPKEMHNTIANQPALADTMLTRLQVWQDSFSHHRIGNVRKEPVESIQR